MAVKFQTFSSSVRPLRVAVLTKADDPDWRSTCLAIIECFTKLWGGGHAIIIPSDGETIDDIFWALLSAHDPDVVLAYEKSGEDLRRNHPSKFKEIVDREVESAIKERFDGEAARRDVTSSLSQAVTEPFPISEELVKAMLTRLAPLSYEGKLWPIAGISAGSFPQHPFTSIFDLESELGAQSFSPLEIDDATSVPKLWLAARFGWSTSDHLKGLNARCGVSAKRDLASHFDEATLIQWATRDRGLPSGKSLFDISQVGLVHVRSTFYRSYKLPTVMVLGDSLQDFCLYYSLLRLHGRAVWAPDWFVESQGRLMSAVLYADELARLSHSKECVVTSVSSQVAAVQQTLRSLPKSSSVARSVERPSVPLVTKIVEHPLRVYAQGSIAKLSTHQLVDGEVPGPFESLKPTVFETLNPQKQRWVVEVAFRKHQIPRHPALGSVVVSDPNLGSWSARMCKGGLAYTCPGDVVVGENVDFNLVRPSIRVPGALDIFRRVLDHCGFECEISDKGRYESEVVSKLGGLEQAAALFRDTKLIALLRKFLDQSSAKKGVCDEGVRLKDGRRYLNFAAVAKVLGSADAAANFIDDFISKGVFFRGFVLRCGHCSDVEWFSVDDIGQAFTCRRCGTSQQYTKANWRQPDEPSWFYKLDEIVYLALLNESTVPVLTLGAIQKKCKESFLYCPELRIRPRGGEKDYMEVDVCCVPDGNLCIGEAKSNGTLVTKETPAAKAANRYRDLADKMGATMVVFSTAAQTWDGGSTKAINSAFEGRPHIVVSKLAASDL